MKTFNTLKIKTTEVIKETEVTRFTKAVTSMSDVVQKCYRCKKLSYISFDCSQKIAETKLLKETDDISFNKISKSESDVNESKKE